MRATAILPWLALALAAPAAAGTAVVQGTGVDTANAGGATTDFQATSYIANFAANLVVIGAGPGMPAAPGLLAPPADTFKAPRGFPFFGLVDLGPTVGVLNVLKPVPVVAQSVLTRTRDGRGSQGQALSEFSQPIAAKPPIVTASTSTLQGGARAYAGARTVDPIALPGTPDGHAYDARLASLALGPDSGEAGFVSYFAFDDRSAAPLFALDVIAPGPVASVGDLRIRFAHDSSRLVLAQTPAEIVDGLRAAFTIDNGVATLAPDHGLFGATYLVPDALSFSFGVSAAVGAAVPEPASWAMLVTGFGLCGASLRRRRRGAAESRDSTPAGACAKAPG